MDNARGTAQRQRRRWALGTTIVVLWVGFFWFIYTGHAVEDIGDHHLDHGSNGRSAGLDPPPPPTTMVVRESNENPSLQQQSPSSHVGTPSPPAVITTSYYGGARKRYVQPLLPQSVLELLEGSSMIDVTGNMTLNAACPWGEKELPSNVAFMKVWSRLLREKFPPSEGGQPDGSGLLWFLDEGGLIGSSRAGAMANADDDFDFFLILPNQHAPCRPDSLTCTPEEFDVFIHRFLMTFWNAGMCINKFNPDRRKFKSRMRLMYSFQLGRPDGVDPERCFIESKPFSHMHLAMFTKEGKLKTNIWALGTTHPMDELDLNLMLPVSRCRAGPVDAPCPRNITGYLTVRNRGEYRSRSSDGACLVVRKRWGEARKIGAVKLTRKLAQCGYNSIVDLADAFERSGYKYC